MEEIWKDIENYEGLYQVSNLGRIRSVDRVIKNNNNIYHNLKGCILKQQYQNNGYLCVTLWKNNKKKLCTVHRLVANAFVKNPFDLPCVNHKDENKTNNIVENLEFCTQRYNNNYGTKNERMINKKIKPVIQFSLDGEFIKEWPSVVSVQTETGYNRGSISNVCLGKAKSAYGYKWKYKEAS